MQKKTLGSLRRVALMTLVLCLGALALASTAWGAPGHALAGSVSTPVTGGLAVNTTSGAVYVADSTGISDVSSGTAVPFVAGSFGGLAVGSTGTVYAIDTSTGAVNRYGSDGSVIGPLDGSTVPGGTLSASAVAVDPTTGFVFVANVAASPVVVDVFDAAGGFQDELAGGDMPFSFPTGMAIDNASNLYVLDGGNVNRYATDGTFETVLGGDFGASAVAADSSTGEVYVVQPDPVTFGPSVVNYDSTGAVLFRFGTNQIFGASGLGVGAAERVYVADPGAGAVQSFDPVIAPDVTTGSATQTATTADLTGTVDPLGQPTKYQFEWGTSSSYGNLTDPVDTSGGTGTEPANAALIGLLPNQDYFYRLIASSETTPGPVTNAGENASFKTDALQAVAVTGAAENVKRTTANVNGTVNPNNTDTEWFFEYGPTDAYGSKTPLQVQPLGDASDHPVTADLTGLEGGVTYHYRLVADNKVVGPDEGADQTFTTLDPLAGLVVGIPTDVTKTSATVHGTVDNHGFPVTYFFTVKATESPYVSSSATVQMAPAAGPQPVSASFTDLPIGSGFEVRLVATSGGGTLVSDPLGFRTQDSIFVPLAPPVVDPNPYGCVSPHLNAYTKKARAGRAITLTGSDLGVGGVVSFGASIADADTWGANAIRVIVPDDARGSASVKVDCARESNSIKVSIAKAAKKKAKAKKCKSGYVKKKVKGKTRCVKKPAKRKAGRKGR